MKANPKQNEVKLATQGTPREIGWGCGPLSKTLTLFMTKICHFPYPIYDRVATTKRYLKFKTRLPKPNPIYDQNR